MITLLCGAESWVTCRRHLRLILNIHWSDFATNIEGLEMAKVTSIETMLLKTPLRWARHVSRTEDHRLPKVVLYGQFSTGHRDKGTSRKRYKITLKESLAACNIDYRQWATQATNCMNWRRTVYQATTSFETTRRANMEDKRRSPNNWDLSDINLEQIVKCSRCGKTWLSRIGFINHQRVYTR